MKVRSWLSLDDNLEGGEVRKQDKHIYWDMCSLPVAVFPKRVIIPFEIADDSSNRSGASGTLPSSVLEF